MLEKMSREQENRIISTVESVIRKSRATPDLDVNSELAKEASVHKFTAPIVQRLVEAFNVARSSCHFKQASDKTSSFQLADASTILDALYPDADIPTYTKKASRDNVVSLQPFEKAAFVKETPLPELHRILGGCRADVEKFNMNVKAARADVSFLEHTVRTGVDDIRQYFRTCDCETLDDVEYNSRGYFGAEKVAALFSEVRAGKDEYGYTKKAGALTVNTRNAPYGAIENALHAIDALVSATVVYAGMSKAAAAYTTKFKQLRKQAARSAGLDTALGKTVDFLGSKDAPSSSMMDSIVKLDVPRLIAMRNNLDAEVMLHEFINNDDVLRHAPLDELLAAFNDIGSTAPDLLGNTGAMRAAVREYVASKGMGSFEAKGLADIAKAQQSTNAESSKNLGALGMLARKKV